MNEKIYIFTYCSSWLTPENKRFDEVMIHLKNEFTEAAWVPISTGTARGEELSLKYNIGNVSALLIYKGNNLKYGRANGVASLDEYRRAIKEVMRE